MTWKAWFSFKRKQFKNRWLAKIGEFVFLEKIGTLQVICQKNTYLSQLPGQISFLVFFCQRKFLPLCKAISNSEKILLENTLNACALIYDGELSFWVCKVSWNQISQYVHELFLELYLKNYLVKLLPYVLNNSSFFSYPDW